MIEKFLLDIKENWKYQVSDCLVIRFHSSQLSLKKKDTKDNTTTSLICPYRLDQTKNIQKAFVHAFNRALYLINPNNDLPDAQDDYEFEADVYRGGDKVADAKLKFEEKEANVTGSQSFKIDYKNILQCKLIYVLKKDELPDPTYKNKISDNFYVSDDLDQQDCCIFFKLIDDVKVKGKSNSVLNNMYVCSKDKDRCMYNALLMAKEL